MAKQIVNIGSSANDRTGDSLRAAFQKINANFTELYTSLGLDEAPLNLGAFEFTGSTLTTSDSSDITIDQNVNITSNLTMSGDIVPAETGKYDLGSPDRQFRSIYVTNNTVFFGTIPLRIDESGTLYVNGQVAATPGGAVTWSGVTGKPTFSNVATSGDYNDLSNRPTIFDGDYNNLSNIPALSQAALSGSYTDLSDKPTIPADVGDLTDTSSLLFDGDYGSLSNTPAIPTAVSQLTNDSGFVTAADIAGGTLTIDVNNTGDLKGSVFGDDSTLLIDGVASKINLAGTVLNNQIYPSIDNGGSVGTSNRRFNEGWFVNAVYVGNFGAEALSQIDGGRIFLTNTASQDPVKLFLNNVEFANNDESIRDGLVIKENIEGTVYTYLVANNVSKKVDFPNGLTGNLTGITDIAKNIESENDVSIRVNLTDSTTRIWRFGEDGDLTLPNGGGINGAVSEVFVDTVGSRVITNRVGFDDGIPGVQIATSGGIYNQISLVCNGNNSGDGIFDRRTIELSATGGFVGVTGILRIEDGVQEKFQTKADATGVVEHNLQSGQIIYHTSPDADWTVNLTNLDLKTGYATTVTLIIVQGGTGYYPSALQIGGAAQTINWQGNATPTPSTNRTDVVTFSIINNSGTYTVLGQLTGF